MEALVDRIIEALSSVFSLAGAGFDGVNQALGLVIALAAALMTSSWRRLPVSALGAVLVHLLFLAMLPLARGGSFVLPEVLSGDFWIGAAALFLGYLIVIAIFFVLKSVLTGAPVGRGPGRRRRLR